MDAAILAASEKHLKPAEKVFQYGTAGFRMKVCGFVPYETGNSMILEATKLEDPVETWWFDTLSDANSYIGQSA